MNIVDVTFEEEKDKTYRGFYWDEEKGHCPKLGPDKRCTIYHDRPKVCREFSCRQILDRSYFFPQNRDVLRWVEEKRTDLNTGSTLVVQRRAA